MKTLTVSALFVSAIVSIAAVAAPLESPVVPLTFTPALMSTMSPPIPVIGTDGKVHVVYELMIANASSFPVKLRSLEVLDAADQNRVLKTYSGDELAANVSILSTGEPASLLPPSNIAIAWFQLALDKPNDVPNLLVHRMSCEPLPPNTPGIPLFDKTSVSLSENLKVDKTRIPIIGPPLEGDKWIAIGGIGTNKGHRRAMLPLNNELYLSQRFANDWMQLDAQNKSVHDSVKKVENYACYGKRVLAVSDANVVEAIDALPDQTIGNISRLHITEYGGNHVILDLGNNRYAFYGHLKPGSVKVKAGDKVKRGQEIGLVGNTGNSSAPHLHFHLCDKASPLGANGIPFVIDSMKVRGKYKSEDQYFDATDKATTVDLVTDGSGAGENEMPIAGVLVDFPTR